MKKVISGILVMVAFFCVANEVLALRIISETKITTDGGYLSSEFSPDGEMILVTHKKDGILIFDANGNNKKIVPMPKNVELGVEKWSPDSKKIIGASVMKDSKLRRVTVLDVSTFGVEFLDIPKSDSAYFLSWSPDSKKIYYLYRQKKDRDIIEEGIWEYNIDTKTKTKVIDTLKTMEPKVSPSGDKIAYFADWNFYSNTTPLWIVDINTKQKTKIGELDWSTILWSPDGKNIFTGNQVVNIDTKEIKSGNFPGGFSYGEYAAWSSDSTKIYSVEGALYGDEPSKVTELYSDLVIWDIFTNSKQVFKTVNYREVDSNWTKDGKKVVCIDANDDNLLLITLGE